MKTTRIFTQIAFTIAIISCNLSTSWATIIPSHLNHEHNINKNLVEAPTIKSPKSDSYLMVMQQQVERGDVSITYSFYMDQLNDLYQINKINADIDTNNSFYMNNLVQQIPSQFLASDQHITEKFLLENAE